MTTDDASLVALNDSIGLFLGAKVNFDLVEEVCDAYQPHSMPIRGLGRLVSSLSLSLSLSLLSPSDWYIR